LHIFGATNGHQFPKDEKTETNLLRRDSVEFLKKKDAYMREARGKDPIPQSRRHKKRRNDEIGIPFSKCSLRVGFIVEQTVWEIKERNGGTKWVY
jgi:hypothetical protein